MGVILGQEFSWSGPAIIFVVGELNTTVLLFISFNRTYASEEMASITTHTCFQDYPV